MERLNGDHVHNVDCEPVPPIVFVFSGESTRSFDVGKDLFRTCEPFRQSILELDAIYESVVGISLVESTGLFASDATEHQMPPLGTPLPIAITLPALTMLQLALVDALAVAGVRPDAVVGHSVGETAVLSASAAVSKVVALRVAIAQGRALSLLQGAKGAMANISCTPDEARSIIAEVRAELGDGVLEIGCYNAPDSLTLSGEEAHVELAVEQAIAAGLHAFLLDTRIPLHSALVKLCGAEFMHLLSDILHTLEECVPEIPVYSSVTGGLFNGSFDAEYLWDGSVQPVLFQDAIEELLLQYDGATFVNIGPQPVLTGYLHSMTGGINNSAITCPFE